MGKHVVLFSFNWGGFVIKLNLRENMKSLKRFLSLVFCMLPFVAHAAGPVATTAGSNLTAYNPSGGVVNNNNWNSLMNNRSGASNAPTADFGNCNSLILRCATPKCANGGCADLEIAKSIVSGCVQSNSACKKYGDDLVSFLAAQMVADAQAAIQQQQLAAQQAAQQAAAAQSNAQMAQMQQQMSQLQYEMQQQNAQQMAQMQAALDEQKQLVAQAQAEAAAEQARQAATVASNNGLTNAQLAAAQSGVSDDVLMREQISGQILSKIENAQTALKTLNATMQNAFEYAGCDKTGDNCTGPKRVKVFKSKAMDFFEPYNDVLDEVYDALITAQMVGVDINDILMMLSGGCSAWGKYYCYTGQVMYYNALNCVDGRSVPLASQAGNDDGNGSVLGGAQCTIGKVVPLSDNGCQPIGLISTDEEVMRNMLEPEEGEDGSVRVGCASDVLDSSALFAGRKKQSTIGIDILERIIEQDAPAALGGFNRKNNSDRDVVKELAKYCVVGTNNYQSLSKAVSMKSLPSTICVTDKNLDNIYANQGTFVSEDTGVSESGRFSTAENLKEYCKDKSGVEYKSCLCSSRNPDPDVYWDGKDCTCVWDGYTFNPESLKCEKD